MKTPYIIISLLFTFICLNSFVDKNDDRIKIKLKYNTNDSGVIIQIDDLILQNDTNSIFILGKIKPPIHNDCDYYSIYVDSIYIEGENFYQKLDLEEGISVLYVFKEKKQWYLNYSIKLEDINKDNYSDIAVYNADMSGNKNHTFNYYLYDPKIKLFKINNIFSLPNLIWDETTKTYRSFSQAGHASLIYTQDTYKIRNDSLIIIKTVNQNYDQTLDKYIRVTKTKEKIIIDTLTIKN
jgi:hypothetical protein